MDENQIREIIKMRRQGHSTIEIGLLFGKDHTTITYHCQKAGLFTPKTPKQKEKITRITAPKIRPIIILPDDEEVINKGMDYADYLALEKKRDWSKRKDVAELEF